MKFMFLAALALGATFAAGQTVAPDIKAEVPGRYITVILKITDRRSGLLVSATKQVRSGANGLQVIQDLVPVKYRNYPDIGAFVTSLCGVEPGPGFAWTFTTDQKWSMIGIGNLNLQQDALIEWETR